MIINTLEARKPSPRELLCEIVCGRDPQSATARRSVLAVLVLVYLCGGIFWYAFFNHGQISFTTGDWAKRVSIYYSVIHESLNTLQLPLYCRRTRELRRVPDTSLSVDSRSTYNPLDLSLTISPHRTVCSDRSFDPVYARVRRVCPPYEAVQTFGSSRFRFSY